MHSKFKLSLFSSTKLAPYLSNDDLNTIRENYKEGAYSEALKVFENLSRSESQFNEFTSELEKLKLEIKKLHTENDVLRHKNRGN